MLWLPGGSDPRELAERYQTLPHDGTIVAYYTRPSGAGATTAAVTGR
jgi:hypothetical protein